MTGRALLVGDETSRGALAAARSLSRAGWTVGIAAPARRGLLPASRHVSERHVVSAPGVDVDGWAATLTTALRGARYDVLFGTGDEWVLALAAGAAALPGRVAHGPYDALQRTFDKLAMSEAAAAAGLPSPRTVPLDRAALQTWQGPVIVKQRLHLATSGSATSRLETRLFDDAAAATGWCEDLLAHGRSAVLQEPVTGALTAVTVLTADDGALVAAVQQVATHVWPMPAGVSALAHTVEPSAELLDQVQRLVGALGIAGLAQVQLLQDQRTGRLHCIDVNPRFYGSMALAVRAGVDFPVLWADLLRGHATRTPVHARVGVVYQWLEGDLRRAVQQPDVSRRSDVMNALRAAPRAVHATVARDDLRPAGAHVAALLRRAVVKARR
jgi:predicted ATP-grasp superfamily ATP-dependent carboligase